MKLLLIISFVVCACVNNSDKAQTAGNPETNILDSLRINSNAAWILFHHQTKKKSLIAKIIFTRHGIDSLFKYVGQPRIDTNCNQGGLYNRFGQISLYKDSLGNAKVGDIHFVLDGNCEGFYLQTEKYLKRYDMTKQGKIFLSELYDIYKNRLK
ncbi:MAG: hypothetical protein K2Q24_05785 [Chitinophagaceae bacterium]|jgi:hypothetical protein|nr:hypothetical protein [Chitinophagaceae bacterium]